MGRTRHSTAGNVGPNLISFGKSGTVLPRPSNPVTDSINNNEIWDAVLNGKYTGGVGPKTDINIQFVYHTKGSRLQTTVGQAKGIQAMRSVEFALCQDFFLTTGARYSDVVLPVTTQWERDGYVVIPNRETAIWTSNVIAPLFEAQDDAWIDWQLGLRLGVYDEATPEISLAQQIFNQVAGATVAQRRRCDARNFGDDHAGRPRRAGCRRDAANRTYPDHGIQDQRFLSGSAS